MILFDNLSLEVPNRALFQNLSFTALAGSIVYIKGSNGSGKSSLLRIIAGLQKPSSGEILVNKVKLNNLQKPFANYIGHELGIKMEVTVWDNLTFWAKLYNALELLQATVFYLNLEEFLQNKVEELSAGMKQKLALARLLLNPSPIWLLDEVNNNLDDANKKLFEQLIISKANSGSIIFIASHAKPFNNNPQILHIEDYV